MFVKDASGRFSFHFRKIYEKYKECIKKILCADQGDFKILGKASIF